jgi:perosamine synthetase
MSARFRIPLSKPDITDADRQAVLDVLRTPYVSSGPKLGEFETAVSAFVRTRYAVGVNSGTSALQLGLRALDLPAGAEVIVPSFAFGAVLNALLAERLKPVFIDIHEHTFNPTPAMIKAAITPETKAILAIHTFGRPLEMDALCGIAKQHSLYVVEDASEALGATWAGRQAGGFGDVGVVAFYANKQITTGEGGMLLTPHEHIATRVRRLRNQGRDPQLDWCQQVEVGFSYRLSEMNCALGIEQLRRIENTVGRRQQLAETYDKKLRSIPGVVRPQLTVSHGRISWFAYVVQVGNEDRPDYRDRVFHQLRANGIECGRYFPPLHWQPVLQSHAADQQALSGTEAGYGKLVNTERVSVRSLALPFFPQMTDSEVAQVCEALQDAIEPANER